MIGNLSVHMHLLGVAIAAAKRICRPGLWPYQPMKIK